MTDRARSVDRRAEPGRAEAAAGSRLAAPGQVKFQQALEVDARRARSRRRRQPSSRRSAAPAAAARPPPRSRSGRVPPGIEGLDHGSVVIAAITSCTNTSNPSVMIGAGLLARNAVKRGPHDEAVGEDEPGAGLAGRHRVLQGGRPARVPRRARLQHRRLRLHDVHRQQRPAARAGVEDRQGQEPRRRVGAERQPQLRGAHPAAGARELSRVAAARGRLRARRAGCRSTSRASRSARTATAQPVYLQGHLADASARSRRRCSARCESEMFRDKYAHVFDGDERWRSLPVPTGDRFAWDGRFDLHPEPAVLRGPDARAGAAVRHPRRARAGACSATASRPITSRRPDRFRRTARPGST